MQYIDYIEEIQDASKNNKLVFFVGAGVSRLSGYPSWGELVNKFYTRLYKRKKRKTFTTEECLQIPEKFYRVRGKEAFDKILKNTFDVSMNSNVVHDKMMLLNPVHFITTNYDDLIEQACNKRGKYFSSISSDNDVANAVSSKYILKVHGDFSKGFDSKNIVLMDKDYLDYESDYPLTSNLMKSIMATHTIVLIGYGLGDHNIKLLLNWVRNLQEEGYKEPFFIRTESDPLDDATQIFYEGKGLRIIESCIVNNAQNTSYEERYVQVLDKLIDTKEYQFLSEDPNDIVSFIYKILSPLMRLSIVRKIDLKAVFDMKYSFEANGQIIVRKRDGVDYIKRFFTIDMKELNSENCAKHDEVKEFFDRNGIWYDREDAIRRKLSGVLDVQNPIYHGNFEQIRKLIKRPTVSIEDDYQRAYFLACLGNFKDAYEAYSSILVRAQDEKDWLMHYLSQINKYRLFQSIKTMMTYGVKSGDVDFVQRLEVEMKDYKINDVFDSMPFEFKSEYKSLEALSDNYYMYSDTVQLFERINKSNESMLEGSYNLGWSPADYAILEMNDNLRFLYENNLWLTSFKDVKDYVKNAIMLMFETAEYDATREHESYGIPFVSSDDSSFHVDYYDFANVCKALKVADIVNLERKCKLERFEFKEQERIREYILRIVNEVVHHFSNGGMNYFFYSLFMEEAKSAIYFSKYIQFSDDEYVAIVKALLFHYPWGDVNEWKHYHWTERLFVNHQLPMMVIPIIEEYLVGQALKHKDEKYFDGKSRHFTGLIRYYYEDFSSNSLSSLALTLDESQDRTIDFMYRLSPILSHEAKEHLICLKRISTVNDIIDALRIEAISDANEYSDIVIDFIDIRYSKIVEERKVGIYSGYGDNYPLDFAIRYFLKEFKDVRMKSFLGVEDQFDLFVSPSTFDFEKFEVSWLRHYSIDLIEEMVRNEHMRPHLFEALKTSAKEAKDTRYYEILTKCFL